MFSHNLVLYSSFALKTFITFDGFGDPTTPPQGTRWTTITSESSLSPIFTWPQGPPSLKRQCSNTSSSLSVIEEQYLAAILGAPYFYSLYVKLAMEAGLKNLSLNSSTLIFLKMIDTLQADYRKSIDGLQEEIDVLNSELDQLQVPAAQPPTTIKSSPDTNVAPESTSAPAQTLHPTFAPALPLLVPLLGRQ
ncbi:hypothetical protein L873DRAFT_1796059 [Choiromyces venosus 120613-1]|uniref:Uncharacterized protein n=1 Tax=Choiromyces venosus 120613-1 TaxID=1336337 RepID=A0A3N4IUN4_9PEZI|nr:hypothetical protein L873DRAFT_1796059 [Choiromyces venosus 120613-1]